MAWYWSDDVARAAVENGLVSERAVADWIHRPVAFAAEEGLSSEEVASRLLGVTESATAGAA